MISNPAEEGRRHQGYAGGPFGFYAILSAINIIDIVGTLVQAIRGRGEGSGYSVAMQNDVHGYHGFEQTQGFRGGRRQRRQRRSGRY